MRIEIELNKGKAVISHNDEIFCVCDTAAKLWTGFKELFEKIKKGLRE